MALIALFPKPTRFHVNAPGNTQAPKWALKQQLPNPTVQRPSRLSMSQVSPQASHVPLVLLSHRPPKTNTTAHTISRQRQTPTDIPSGTLTIPKETAQQKQMHSGT